MRRSPIIELFFPRFLFLILDSVMVYVVALKKFDWPTPSYRQEFGWRKHQDIDLQSGKLAINAQVCSHVPPSFQHFQGFWCLHLASNCIDACDLLLFCYIWQVLVLQVTMLVTRTQFQMIPRKHTNKEILRVINPFNGGKFHVPLCAHVIQIFLFFLDTNHHNWVA